MELHAYDFVIKDFVIKKGCYLCRTLHSSLFPTSSLSQLRFKAFVSIAILVQGVLIFYLKQRKYYTPTMAIESSKIEAYAQLTKCGFNSSRKIINMHWYSDSFPPPRALAET